jgi:hypothetical protein
MFGRSQMLCFTRSAAGREFWVPEPQAGKQPDKSWRNHPPAWSNFGKLPRRRVRVGQLGRAVQDRNSFLAQRRSDRGENPGSAVTASSQLVRAPPLPTAEPGECCVVYKSRRSRRIPSARPLLRRCGPGGRAVGRQRALQLIDAIFELGELAHAFDHQRRQLARRFHIVRGVAGWSPSMEDFWLDDSYPSSPVGDQYFRPF